MSFQQLESTWNKNLSSFNPFQQTVTHTIKLTLKAKI